MTKSSLTRVIRWCSPFRRSLHTTSLSSVFLAIVAAAAFSQVANSTAQKQDSVSEARVLAPGDIVQRRLDAAAMHSYELTIAARQFARVVVDQKGVDIVLLVEAPIGTVYRKSDNPNGFYGPEIVSIAAPATTTYAIKIFSDNKLIAGNYELRVEESHEASASDEQRVTAERLFSEAQILRGEARGSDQKLDSAIRKYNEASSLWRELGDRLGEGYCLTNIARTYRARVQVLNQPDHLRQDYLDQVFEHFRKAQSILSQAGDTAGQTFVLNELGSAHRDFGDPREAIESYKTALDLRRRLGDRYGEAQLCNNLGLSYSLIGYQLKALEYYEIARPIWRELGISNQEMNTLLNAAKANTEMGDVNTAFSQLNEVLTYCNTELEKKDSLLKVPAKLLKPFALNGLGMVYDTWANADLAQLNYKQALELFHENANSGGEADVFDNLGLLYALLGDPSQALEHFQSALEIRKYLYQPKGWGVTLSNMGYAHALLGNNPEALRQLNLALPLCERAHDMRFMAFTLVRIGMAHVASKKPQKALEIYQKAFAIQLNPEFADRRGQAITLDKMGEALALSGAPIQALEKYTMALERWAAVGDGQGQAFSLYGIAKIESNRQHLIKARDRIEEAIQKVEKQRHTVTNRQLQMIYFAGKQDLYQLAIDVRMRLYELTKAPADMEIGLSLSEQARARNLLDLLSEARADVPKGMSGENAETNARLQQEINQLAQSVFRFRSIGLKVDAATAENKLTEQIDKLDELRASARNTGNSASPAQLAQPLTPPEIQQLLDDDTMVLEYALDQKRSHLWSVTRTRIEHHFLPGRLEIEKTANQLGQLLTSYEQKRRPKETDQEYLKRLRQPPNQYRASALKLGQMVLGKILSQLGNKRLVIVADGALQYIPFEVLLISGSAGSTAPPVSHLSRNEVVYQPSASTLAQLRNIRRPTPSKSVAVFADPVFDIHNSKISPTAVPLTAKEKLIGSLRDIGDDDFTLPRLTYSLKEAEAIIAVAPPDSWMKAVGFQANRAAATSPALRQFGIVHFATHGIVNDKHPELSGIVLSLVNERGEQEEGYLTLHDIYGLDLPVRLVVLSACRTGIGKSVRGEGLIALTRGFMYAGAESVVVSLWRVDDEATAELMKRFYNHMLGPNKLPPTQALRQAKLEMQAHTQERWRAPYYWAGFVLQGDWK